MLNDWRTRPVGTVGRRRSATGATIVPVWIPLIPTVVIMDRIIAEPAITATLATRAIPATAVTGAPIPIKEILPTIGADE
jgi:hypothetical protein